MADNCCKVVMVNISDEDRSRLSEDVKGVYVEHGHNNHRISYKHIDQDLFIYFYDWGPNSGANWMIGTLSGSSGRIVETYNLEDHATDKGSECLVSENSELQWKNVQDNDNIMIMESFSITCV